MTVDMEMEVSSDEEEDETEALPVRQQQDDTGVQVSSVCWYVMSQTRTTR